jgi:hypothetical protein
MAFLLLNTVSATGAPAGTVLRGIKPHNHGVRIAIVQGQPRGDGGPVHGLFRLLGEGDNQHSEKLRIYVGMEMTAGELLRIVREEHPMCVNPVNANGLAIE